MVDVRIGRAVKEVIGKAKPNTVIDISSIKALLA